MTTSAVPVGTVLPYAGNLSSIELNELGWAVCDGADYNKASFPDLYKAIGDSCGADESTFHIPNYQGFFLRGVDPKGAVDPDVLNRTPMYPGGSRKGAAGSIQGYATASPANKFMATLPHIPNHAFQTHKTTGKDTIWEDDVTRYCVADSGGDAETRPINAYVNFIIKVSSTSSMPLGSIVYFAGNPSAAVPEHLLICDGASVETGGSLQDLYNAIGDAHGATETGRFNLPDYCGRFLRGATNDTANDPDAETRTSMAQGGNEGNNIGSVQDWATALPKSGKFQFGYYLQPRTRDVSVGSEDAAMAGSPKAIADFTSYEKGGDKESRPSNVYVDHYIVAQNAPNGSDVLPIGAVIGYAGSAPPSRDEWLLCDGSTYSNAGDGPYGALFKAIGYCNGGDGATKFRAPDYQGYFLRGRDNGKGRDPDVALRKVMDPAGGKSDSVGTVQSFATGRPKKPITGPLPYLPGTDTPVVNAGNVHQSHSWSWNPETLYYPVSGGDKETRPVNAYIYFYIKYAETAPNLAVQPASHPLQGKK
jgi:microcystin-dependent protein